MLERRFLLPITASTGERRMAGVRDLVAGRHRAGLLTHGWVEDVYPDERGWVEQPGNNDPKQRVYYAVLYTRRRRKDDK